MTAMEIVEKVETVGGTLILNGDKVRYSLPEKAAALVDQLREHRSEVVGLLQKRFTDAVANWVRASCVASRNCAGNPKIMYREYRAANASNVGTYGAFLEALVRVGFQLDAHQTVVGLCLAQDWIAAWQCEQAVVQ